MRFFILVFVFLSLASCKKYAFVKDGHFIDGVDAYFNPTQHLNIWVYMDYLAYDGNRGLQMGSLYPKDREIFKLIGLRGRRAQVFFTAKPMNSLNYHLAVLKHKRRKFKTHGYQQFKERNSFYLYKDIEHDFLVIRHVLIPYGKNEHISMVYYIDKDKHTFDPFKRLNYLAEINARELQKTTPFRNFWQVSDCPEEKMVPASIKIWRHAYKKREIIYLEMFTLYDDHRGISFVKLLTRDDPDSLPLALCPNSYAIEYRDADHKLLAVDTLHVAE